MNAEDFIRKLKDAEMPVVSLEAAGNIIQKPAAYTRIYVYRLYKRGTLKRIENGLYCLRDTDDYTIASRIIPYSYITSYAALKYYRLTTQIPLSIQIISPKYHRKVRLKNYSIEFSKVKKEFIYGYTVIRNGPVFAEPEKVFVDDLYLHRRQYYGEEFGEAIAVDKLDIEKLKRYAIRSGDRAVVSMAGYYLEKQGVAADDLLPYKANAYLRLNIRGALNRKWRVRE